MRHALSRIAVFCALALSAQTSPASETLLQEGDHVAVCGDSITERNVYSVYVEDYLLMCRPAPGLRTTQFGWSGERSWDFQRRIGNDVLPFHPTVATVLYGMNDGGYTRQEKVTIDRYHASLTDSVGQLRDGGVRLIVLGSPTLVDPATYKKGPAPVYNETLDALAETARTVATEQGIPFADIHTPFRDVMKKAKAKWGDSYALGGPDGIHPSDAGHLVIAYALLKALGCSGEIGTISFDWDTGQAQASDGHQIVSVSDRKISIRSSKYPFCFPTEAAGQHGVRDILEFLPFNQDLNRFTLRIAHAPDEGVKVTWGSQTKSFPKAALENGINLAAEFPDNPFCETFRKTELLIKEKQLIETRTIKGLLHTFLEWQALFPEDSQREGESFARLKKALLSKDDQLIQNSEKSVVPVTHLISLEINR